MKQVTRQHVRTNEIEEEMIKLSFERYIDHFDPQRVYLLDREIDSYQNLSTLQASRVLTSFNRERFDQYEKLNDKIAESIYRARKIREEILRNPAALIKDAKTVEVDEERPFAKSIEELRDRAKEHAQSYLAEQMDENGEGFVRSNLPRVLRGYEDSLEEQENLYLFVGSGGEPLSAEAKENLFALHLLKAFAKSLDSHTRFYDRTEAHDMRVRLEKGFKGIGIVLQKKYGEFVISDLIEGGPADRSGKVEKEDRIIAVNGENMEGKSLQELMKKLREASKTHVSLLLKRGAGKEVRVELLPELVSVKEERVDLSYVPFQNGIIGKITLYSFYQGENGITSEKDVRKAILKLKEEGNLKGLVLDLRENSGGYLYQAVKVAGLFITNGVVVVSKYADGEEKIYRDMDGKSFFDGPVVVLTSKATASASEIVAQALQDYGVAVVVGDQQTYGKGTIQSQTVTDHESTSYFKVTVGKYYTVSGQTPQNAGVKADVVVPSHYLHEEIGERFLERTIAADTQPSYYKDRLQDIDEEMKPWYLRYYTPKLQKKTERWKEKIPALNINSQKRLFSNLPYQNFMNSSGDGIEKVPELQMEEAVHIVEDMIELNRRSYDPTIVEYSK